METWDRYPHDDWTPEGSRIDAPEKVAAIKAALEKGGSVIVRHWHYKRACCPTHHLFEEMEDYLAYFSAHVRPGDGFDVWELHGLLDPVSRIAEGRFPDDDGAVPRVGAY